MSNKAFGYVNLQALPKFIRDEFEKVYVRYSIFDFNVPYNIEAYKHLQSVQFLLVDENNDAISDDEIQDLLSFYASGFNEGYDNFEKLLAAIPILESNDSTRLFRIFSLVYGKEDDYRLFPLISQEDDYILLADAMYSYGVDIGRYVMAWQLIVNNANMFEKIFEDHKAQHEVLRPVTWEGDKIELIELFKALHVSGRISGVQANLIKRFEAFFCVDLRNHSKAFNDLKNRNNGSETLLLDTLKHKLKQWINKESKS